MKKIVVLLTGVIMAAALAACTPTTEKNKETRPARTEMPAGAETQESIDGLAEKVPDKDAPPEVTVCIYSVKKDGLGLKQNMDSIDGEELDEQLLMDKMAELGVVEEGIKVQSFEHSKGLIKIDLSGLKNADDPLVLTAVVNTFLQNYEELDGQVELSINGTPVKEEKLTYVKDYKSIAK